MIQNFEIWRLLKHEDTRDKYVETLNVYPIYFLTAVHAHFVAYVIASFTLFENRKDTYNFRSFSTYLNELGAEHSDEINQIDDLIKKTNLTHKKVSLLRNNVFGHKSMKLNDQQAFDRVGISSNEMNEYTELCKSTINEISATILGSRHAFNLNAGQCASRLLRDLKRRHGA